MAAQDHECAEAASSNPELEQDLSDDSQPVDHRFRWARTVRFVFEFRAPGDEDDVCVESALQGLIGFAAEATINRCLDKVAERHRCKLYSVVSREYALTPGEQLSSPPCGDAVPCPTLPPLTTVMAPTVHVNGTARELLLQQSLNAAGALRKAIEALSEAAPNGCDFYPQGPAAIRAAMEQHMRRVRRLQSVYDELERIAELIADANCVHTREPEPSRHLGLITRVSG